MTIDEMLRKIHDCGCEEPATVCGCWKEDDGLWETPGESADGVPDWTLWSPSGDGWVVGLGIGWYTQSGNAASNEDAVRLAMAFDAAAKALNASLNASGFGRDTEIQEVR